MAGNIMPSYSFQDTVNISALDSELIQSSLSSVYQGVVVNSSTTPQTINVYTSVELTQAQQTQLATIISTHIPATLSSDQILNSYQRFGEQMMSKWQNIILSDGIIGSGSEHEVASKLEGVSVMANQGQLFALDIELSQVIPVPVYLEAERIRKIRNEVRVFVGLTTI